jgi:hypothetical protein
MKREYNDGTHKNVTYFVGLEIEKTPAYGLKTLFVVGLQKPNEFQNIVELATFNNCNHIYFGANKSFRLADNTLLWEDMIEYFLKLNYTCTFDFDIGASVYFSVSKLMQYETFIPIITVDFPHINQYNKNTVIKLDDICMSNPTNKGVWCNLLSELTNNEKFTSWDEYTNDEVLL